MVQRAGDDRPVTAGQLVLALRAGLDAGEAVGNRIIDGLMVADLEMQEGVILDAAPVAAVERVGAAEINGAGDMAPGSLRHHQHDAFAHRRADRREEGTVEIGPTPFARTSILVEREEIVPDCLGKAVAGEDFDGDVVGERLAPLTLQRLALARGQCREEIVIAAEAFVLPVELKVVALDVPGLLQRGDVRFLREGDMD